jgi:Ser/Thr protein kinase RdoA (MazF antagonist)
VLPIDEIVRFAAALDDQWHAPVADAAGERWGLQRPVFIRSSASHVFVARARASGDGPRVVLRMRPDGADACEVLERGAAAAGGWRRAGAPFVDVVPSVSGRLVERVNGYAVTGLVAAEGDTLEESGVDCAGAPRWGETLARLHHTKATSLPPGLPATEELVTADDLGPELARVARSVGEALGRLPQHAGVRGVLHGDPEPDNVVVCPDRMVLVDPDDVRVGWFVSDIAFALRDWADPAGWLDWRRGIPAAFLEGYRAVRPVTAEELTWVPLLVAAAALEDLSALQPHLQRPAQDDWPDWATALDTKIRVHATALRRLLLSSGFTSCSRQHRPCPHLDCRW